MRVLHLFAGAGGSHLTGELLGWESVGSVEIDPYCQRLLRQHYPNEVIHGDIRTFQANHLAGVVDGVCGGFPCTDISAAGKGAGITGEHSGLWSEFARVIAECRPGWAFIENSPRLRSLGLDTVLQDLARIGYNAEWSTLSAAAIGAPHKRDRMWILATDPNRDWARQYTGAWNGQSRGESAGDNPWRMGKDGANAMLNGLQDNDPDSPVAWSAWLHVRRHPQPLLPRVGHGMAHRVDRIKAIGNGWVPQQAAYAWLELAKRTLDTSP